MLKLIKIRYILQALYIKRKCNVAHLCISYIYKAENVFLCVSLSVCVCVCPFAIEIHTSKAMTMSVCTRINTRPGKVLVEIRS